MKTVSSGRGRPDAVDARTRLLLEGPVVPLLLRLSWPNMLVVLAQSGTGLIELWFVARLGTESLAAMALVTPVLILMQNMSQGAMGGGIASAIARALGAGKRDKADSFVFHALVITAAIGAAFGILVLLVGRPLYRFLGGAGHSLDGAMTYSNIIFGGMVLLWTFNALAAAIRGTGNMKIPGLVICGGALLLIPISPCLIYGVGPVPSMGIAGGGIALLLYYGIGTIVLGWYAASGRSLARIRWARLRWDYMREILAVGAVASVNSIQINITIAGALAIVAAHAGPAALAGLGTGTRLEYLLPPLGFGFGAALVALVGANIGARQPERALRIALVGGAMAFALTESVGLSAAMWPVAWLRLFDTDPEVLAIGATYLRIVGPFFGFFGVGITLYFASQGAGRLGWPLVAGLVRVIVTLGGGLLALRLTGSLNWLFGVYALGMVVYGAVIAIPISTGSWFRKPTV